MRKYTDIQACSDLSFLVGVRYGREQEREATREIVWEVEQIVKAREGGDFAPLLPKLRDLIVANV